MKQKIHGIAWLLCVALLFLSAALVRWAQNSVNAEKYTEEPLQPLAVTCIDVGKGDAFLLSCAGQTLLIDTGYKNTFSQIQDVLQQQNISQIDTLLITHFDKDHVGGGQKLIKSISVGTLYLPNYEPEGGAGKNFLESLSQSNIQAEVVDDAPLSFSLGDAACTLYPPLSSKYEGDNDHSLVLRIEHGADTYLFAGDAEDQRLQELLGQLPLESLFLKVPHHGRFEETSTSFLRAVAPQYAFITCSQEEAPDKEVLSLLNELGTQTFLSSQTGTITFTGTGAGLLEIR